ncbi:Uncharacterised protein [Achromobacter sp. 2789STDY5608615]|nr:Uncharacterised protein [Achromobacter sp. 2789STDY5608615]
MRRSSTKPIDTDISRQRASSCCTDWILPRAWSKASRPRNRCSGAYCPSAAWISARAALAGSPAAGYPAAAACPASGWSPRSSAPRPHRARVDQRHPHAVRRGFQRQRLGQAADRELGGAVGAPAGAAAIETEDRRDIEYVPRALGAQARHHRAHHVQHAEHVDIEAAAQGVVGQRFQRPGQAVAGVVDHHVDAAERGNGGVDRAAHVAFIGQIHFQRQEAAFELGAHGLHQHIHIVGRGRDVAPLIEQHPDQRQTQAARGACDKPDFFGAHAISLCLQPPATRRRPAVVHGFTRKPSTPGVRGILRIAWCSVQARSCVKPAYFYSLAPQPSALR